MLVVILVEIAGAHVGMLVPEEPVDECQQKETEQHHVCHLVRIVIAGFDGELE